MTFAAMAAWQAWLILALAAAAAVVVFRLKLRPPRVTVPSLLFWRRVLDQARPLTWWERVRRAVSLAATVAIALALALALTRPGPLAASSAGSRVLIVLDSSWSMATSMESGGTRWSRAVSQARALAAASGGDVAVATTADGLVEGPTSDTALVDAALSGLAPSGGARGAWPQIAGDAAVHFFTDGVTARTLDPTVRLHGVFEAAPNVAITAFGVRPARSRAIAAEAYIEIVNYTPRAQEARLELRRGTEVLLDKPLALDPGQALRTTVALTESGTPDVRARISARANALEADDTAVAWIPPALTVVGVGDPRGAVAKLLESSSGMQVTWVGVDAYRPGREDVVVFDRTSPAQPPSRPALFITPPAQPWLGEPGAEERDPRWSSADRHPIVAGLDLRTLTLSRTRGFSGPGLEVAARTDRGTPLMLVADTPERRVAVLTFGAPESNLATAAAFPVLIGNALEWLARPGDGEVRQPGPVFLPPSTTRVIGPDGREVSLTRAGVDVSATLSTPGLYTVEGGGARRRIAVNVADPDVSQVSRSTLDPAALVAPVDAGRPWWLYALVVALAIVCVEWWTWQRRITV